MFDSTLFYLLERGISNILFRLHWLKFEIIFVPLVQSFLSFPLLWILESFQYFLLVFVWVGDVELRILQVLGVGVVGGHRRNWYVQGVAELGLNVVESPHERRGFLVGSTPGGFVEQISPSPFGRLRKLALFSYFYICIFLLVLGISLSEYWKRMGLLFFRVIQTPSLFSRRDGILFPNFIWFFFGIGFYSFISFEKTSVGWVLIHLLPQGIGALPVSLRIVEGEGS